MSKANRIDRLRANMAEKQLDAFLVSSSENRAYFSGFHGSAGYLWITPTDAMLATDFRYTEQAAVQAIDYRVVRIAGGLTWFDEAVADSNARRIGFEDSSMTVSLFNSLRAKLQERDENWSLALDTSVLTACNHQLCEKDMVLCDGDEVAFFPPVTGG